MGTSDQEQMGQFVRQHKRIAMGEKLSGSSMGTQGQSKTPEKKSGGLAQAKKK
jgi:hypothetical protein